MIEIGTVIEVSANAISVEIDGLEKLQTHKEALQIGRYLLLSELRQCYIVCTITQIAGSRSESDGQERWKFRIACQPMGTLDDEAGFQQGCSRLPVPTNSVYVPETADLARVFSENRSHSYPLAPLAVDPAINLLVDGNAFFSKHLAVVGSTGSGKSCTVTKLLQNCMGIQNGLNLYRGDQRNAHIIIFDLHGEYRNAFRLDDEQSFSLNTLDLANLSLPYWLLNSDELEALLLETSTAHNILSQFKTAVIANKQRHNPSLSQLTYDTPVYFSLREVYQYLDNLNREVIDRVSDEVGDRPKLKNGELISRREDVYFDQALSFAPQSTAAANKATKGPFQGDFNKLLLRLESKLNDRRLNFLLGETKPGGGRFCSDDFEALVTQILGYQNRSNITVIDLSGIPFETLSIVVSVVARMCFDFCLHYSKQQAERGLENDVPVMLVCEESHNYIPQSSAASYRPSLESIERIAKEGRKYGLTLMVVSQRPSEVSRTVLAQCNNFVALRLTNDEDKSYVRAVLPNNLHGIVDLLPNLRSGEALIIGEAVMLPAVAKFELPSPQPRSSTVPVISRWEERWKDVHFTSLVQRWRQQEP